MNADLPLTETLRYCPICMQADNSQPVHPPHIRRCPHCGVMYMSPRPKQADILRHYDAGHTYREWKEHRQERETLWLTRLRLVRRYCRAGRLLDIATGDGHFLDVARTAGFEVEGTELSSHGALEARQRGQTVHIGQLLEIGLPDNSFDVITMWHALEHMPDPGCVLKEVHRLLRPGGSVIVAVPNEQKKLLKARFWALRSPFGDGTFLPDSEIHLTFFTPPALKRALRNSGFLVIAFGVDNVYGVMTPLRWLKIGVHRILCLLFSWHFSIAMWVVARKT